MSAQKIVRGEYPRPQFQRESFLCLNGKWEFSFEEPVWDKEIVVPFAYQTKCSGIEEKKLYQKVWYRKTFSYSYREADRILLHIGAADYRCKIWLNSIFIAEHEGGQTPIDVEVTHAISSENELIICVEDFPYAFDIPRGKQIWKERGESIFYTSITGIWQSVWLETVPETYLERVWMTPDIDKQTLTVAYEIAGNSWCDLRISIFFEGIEVAVQKLFHVGTFGECVIEIVGEKLGKWNFQEELTWSPQNPCLFDITFELYEKNRRTDLVHGYFGMRKISVEGQKVYLNNRVYYQKLILDQGYWKDSLWTAPSDEAYIKDIELVKEMGFEGVRMHQKIEDPRFLYHADKMGLLVWEEMGAAYRYSRNYVKRMTDQWMETIFRDYNHPCIIAWVPLNESWGVPDIKENVLQQKYSLALAALTKALDHTRLVMSNDGWEHTDSDLCTVHDYEWNEAILRSRYRNQETLKNSFPANRPICILGFEKLWDKPMILSEFGGVSYKKSEIGWGYSHADNEGELRKSLRQLMVAVKDSPIIQGFCYTQLADVEQEMNGLLDAERNPKIPVHEIRKIFE